MYKEKNEELMCRYKAGEHELLWELVELNMGICYKFAHKYHLSGLDFDDMVSMMKGFLIEAIERVIAGPERKRAVIERVVDRADDIAPKF